MGLFSTLSIMKLKITVMECKLMLIAAKLSNVMLNVVMLCHYVDCRGALLGGLHYKHVIIVNYSCRDYKRQL